MAIHALAGRHAPSESLIDVPVLESEYYLRRPDVSQREERVMFGAAGHHGSALGGSFTEAHVLAIAQAIFDHRRHKKISGPLYLGRDTHALSEPAFMTALEVFAGNGAQVLIDREGSITPAPVVSHAILAYNRARTSGLADGVFISSCHNPPDIGGIRYYATTGGAADATVASWIEHRANLVLSSGLAIGRTTYEHAMHMETTRTHDCAAAYVDELGSVVDLEAIRSAGLKIGVDPLGGAALDLWRRIAVQYRLDVEIVDDMRDPTFRFVPVDWDGRIRPDCASPYAMGQLIRLKDRFDIALATDPDADRHGVVTRRAGLMNPAKYFASIVFYLCTHRPEWPAGFAIGKTIEDSSLIDRLALRLGSSVFEVPPGFEGFVGGLLKGSIAVAGCNGASATCVRRDGSVWSTEADGLVMGLLAAELMARTGSDPSELYDALTRESGTPAAEHVDVPLDWDGRDALRHLEPDDIHASELAGEPIQAIVTKAPGNCAAFGGVKVVTEHGWFAARPSEAEPLYTLHAETFRGSEHLRRIQEDARTLIDEALAGSATPQSQILGGRDARSDA
jgi:phosphoglucomutase